MHVFWKNGYTATGLVELEQATGLGRQSLYGVFGDKRGLFLKVVDHYFERVLAPGVALLDAPGSARQNIESLLQAWEATSASPDFHGCLVGNSVPEFGVSDLEMADVLSRKLALLEAGFTRALKRAKRDGEVKSNLDVKATARSIVTLGQGLALLARAHRDPSFVRSVLQSARSWLD
jgi:TetR/AcrR family transcriptional regulator, transcriptional repressor for nem operon